MIYTDEINRSKKKMTEFLKRVEDSDDIFDSNVQYVFSQFILTVYSHSLLINVAICPNT